MITSFPSTQLLNKIGSVIKFYFIEVGNILFEPEIFNGKLIGDYTFQPGKELLLGLYDYETAKLEFSDSSSNKGNLTKNAFSAFISGNSPEYDHLFCEMRTKKFIAFIADFEKNVRVLGRAATGATFDFSFSTKNKYSDTPGFEYKFTCAEIIRIDIKRSFQIFHFEIIFVATQFHKCCTVFR